MKFLSDFKEIAQNYQYFLFDVWGVIHDGISAYPNAVETILWLKNHDKNICFLSNAPRRAFKVEEVLKNYGIERDFYDFIITSGEATYLALQEKNQFGQNYFYIGPQKDIDLLENSNYNIVKEAKSANFAIATGFDGQNSTLEEKLPQIQAAISAKLPLICVNPDMIVIRKNGDEMICAGLIAKTYQELGGEVIYYGKPYQAVYDIVCKKFGQNIDKNDILAIGDGLETDIKGANSYGIDSILVTSGILSNKLGIKYGEQADEAKLQEICNAQGSFPEYVITNL